MGQRTVGCMVLLTLSLCMALGVADGQPAGKVAHIGVVEPGSAASAAGFLRTLSQELRTYGWSEGQNLVVTSRLAEGDATRLPALVAELVRLPVDVLVTRGAAAEVAQRATQTIPIVMLRYESAGLVASLAQPGGNLTGVSIPTREYIGKQLELLKELVPGLTRVAMLLPKGPSGHREFQEAAAEAPSLGVHVHLWEVQGPRPDFEGVFQSTATEPVDAVLCHANLLFYEHRERITTLAAQHRLPVMYGASGYVRAGGLIAYGADSDANDRRMAYYVDRILRGAKPAELPVERPMKFYLGINLPTAQALGLTIPAHLLVLADEVLRWRGGGQRP